MALIINPEPLNTFNNTLNITLKKAPLNELNLSLNTLNDNLNDAIQKKSVKPSIKKLIDIYEQSTQASTTEEEQQPSEATTNEEAQTENPTKELIRFLINRNREDAKRFKLTHFKNIRCKDDNNKSCIIPIYKAPENPEEQNEAEKSNLLIQTINYKYAIFIRDIYNIKYRDLMERMDARYKINVGLFKE